MADFAQVLRVAKKQRWAVVALDLGEIISQRTAEALAEAKESGVKLGRGSSYRSP